MVTQAALAAIFFAAPMEAISIRQMEAIAVVKLDGLHKLLIQLVTASYRLICWQTYEAKFYHNHFACQTKISAFPTG